MTAPTREAHRIPSPGGKVPSVSEADEECGRRPGDKYTVSGFFPCPTFRHSSPAPFGGTLPPGEGICGRSMTAPTRATHQRVCHCEGALHPWQSPGTILRPHRHRYSGNILPGDSHGRHSRPRNDKISRCCDDFSFPSRKVQGGSKPSPTLAIIFIRRRRRHQNCQFPMGYFRGKFFWIAFHGGACYNIG